MNESLALMMRQLRLPTFAEQAQRVAIEAERAGWGFSEYLAHLAELEIDARRRNRIERYTKAAQLPFGKTLSALDKSLLPSAVQKRLPALCERCFADKGHNLLAFGLPGRGKTHLLAGIGYALVEQPTLSR